MQSIAWGVLDVALSNATVAAAAAVLVWIVARICRKPALSHALWLIVLLKLITPPIWNVPVHVRHAQSVAVASVSRHSNAAPFVSAGEICVTPSQRAPVETNEFDPSDDSSSGSVADESITVLSAPESAAIPSAPPAAVPGPAPGESVAAGIQWRQWLAPGIVALWAVVSILSLMFSALRIARFHRTLRFAIPAPLDLQRDADRLGRCMGIKESARVWLVPGAVCPMLWGIGKARVLVPRELWGRLDRRQRHTLLVHELAHLRRRDHWVRYVELFATALYWWNPICWWARHELREAEEQCCDAWVMEMMPGAFREYAHALLEAVDFVSADLGGAPRRDAVPTLASGMGQFGHLKRRLTMLKQGQVARALSWSSWSAVVGVGALLLPLTPTLGQEKETPKPAEVTQKTPEVQQNVSIATSSAPAAEPISKDAVEVNVSETPTAPEALPPGAPGPANVAPVPVVPPPLVDAPDILPVTPGALPPAPEGENDDEQNADDAKNRDRDFRRKMQDVQRQKANQQRAQSELARAQAEVKMLSQRLQEASARLQKLQADMQQQGLIAAGKMPFNFETAPNPLTAPKEFKLYIDGQMNQAKEEMRAATKDGKVWIYTRTKDGDSNNKTPTGILVKPRGSDDERMDRLEKQLSELMKEVRDLRRERGRSSSDNKPGNEDRGR